MNKRMIFAAFSVLAVVTSATVYAPAFAQTDTQAPTVDTAPRASVKNKAYDVWVSPNFASPPYQPFHDCFRFSGRQLCIEGCGDECGPISEVPLLGVWQARVSCGGLNLVFIGTSLDGPATKVIGGSAAGSTESTNFGFEGVVNPSCSSRSRASAGSSMWQMR